MSSDNKNPFDSEFTGYIYQILARCDTETKPLFESFVDKVRDRMKGLQQEVDQLRAASCGTSTNSKLTNSVPVDNVDSAKLISESQLIASFDLIQGRVPKVKLRVEFYGEFLALISQNKQEQNDKKTIIEYSCISQIACVPDKHRMVTLFVALKQKIPLKWRKQSVDNLLMEFEDLDGIELEDEDQIDLEIANHGTSLPAKLQGTAEVLFCRIFSELSKCRIARHDKTLFSCMDHESKSKVYFVEPNVRHNKCQVFPLRSGLLLMPKPLRFVPQQRIKYFENTRKGQGLRYGEMNIVLSPEGEEKEYVPTGDAEKDKKAERERKKRLKDNTITLEMIPNAEMCALEIYFNEMRIECKMEGQDSPQRKGTKKRTRGDIDSENEEGKEMDSATMEMDDSPLSGDESMSADDEEFNPDDHQPSDSEDMDSDEDSDGDGDGGNDEMVEEEEEEDVDLKELRNVVRKCKMTEKGESTAPKDVTNRRKRKRSEMEKGEPRIDFIEIDGDSDDDDGGVEEQENRSPFKRVKLMGRKTTNYGQKGSKMKSKSIDKKKCIAVEVKDEGKESSVEFIKEYTPKKRKRRRSKSSSPKKGKKEREEKKSPKRSKSKKKKSKKHNHKESQQKMSDFFKKSTI